MFRSEAAFTLALPDRVAAPSISARALPLAMTSMPFTATAPLALAATAAEAPTWVRSLWAVTSRVSALMTVPFETSALVVSFRLATDTAPDTAAWPLAAAPTVY